MEGCNFELCMYSSGNPPRTFPLCPRCFNDTEYAIDPENLPEDEDERFDESKEREIRKMAGKHLTLECPHPDDHPIVYEQ